MMTRRHLMLFGITSAAASFAALTPGRASQATGSVKDASKGTIYVYAWEGGDGKTEIVQGIFALDTERMTWTKVAAPQPRPGAPALRCRLSAFGLLQAGAPYMDSLTMVVRPRFGRRTSSLKRQGDPPALGCDSRSG
jgi:hypothetical protein